MDGRQTVKDWLYGVLGISVGVLVLAAFMLAANAHDEDAPPSTSLLVCGGTLPVSSLRSNHDAPCYSYDIGATEIQEGDYLGHRTDDEFRHVYFQRGDPACIFTARRGSNPEGAVWLHDVAGGRDCNASTPDGQCAYIAEGWAVYGVTGGSCSEAGVPICTGIYCI